MLQRILHFLLILLFQYVATKPSISTENKCMRICRKEHVFPSLWRGCLKRKSSDSYQRLNCSQILSQNCTLWRDYLQPHPLPTSAPQHWNDSCNAVFGNGEDLVLLTVASKPSGMFGMMLLSALRRGLKVTVVGWNFFAQKNLTATNESSTSERTPRHGKYFSGYKIVSIYMLLEQCSALGILHPDQRIMFVDGTDTVFQQDRDFIMGELNHMLSPIIFSTERDMFPATTWVRNNYPKTYVAEITTIFGHLNSGAWVARVGAMRRWFWDWVNAPYISYRQNTVCLEKLGNLCRKRLVIDSPQPRRVMRDVEELWRLRNEVNETILPRCYQVSDQFNAAHMYIQGVENATLDSFARLFVSMWIPRKESSKFFEFAEAKVISKRTNSTPAVLHFNGPAKLEYCGTTSLTYPYDEAATRQILREHIVNKNLQMLDADLRLLPQHSISEDVILASISNRYMICSRNCNRRRINELYSSSWPQGVLDHASRRK